MKRQYPLSLVPNPLIVLRKAGYAPFKDPQTEKESYVIRLTEGFYPRFHLYVEATETGYTFDLHLDQKQPSYGSSAAHNGEYDGPKVAEEFNRLEGWIKYSATQL